MASDNVIHLKEVKGYDTSARTVKVTLCSLALAIEYFTDVVKDDAFVREAKSCLRTVDSSNVIFVPPELQEKVLKTMSIRVAMQECLLG